MKVYYREKWKKNVLLCLPRFSQTAKLRALSSKLPSLLKTFHPNCKGLGASYQVREKNPHKITLTFSTNCRFGGGVQGRGIGLNVPCALSGSRICYSNSQYSLKPSIFTKFYHRESEQVVNSQRKRCVEQHLWGFYMQGFSCPQNPLSSWHQYADCQSDGLTQALVSRIFTMPSKSKTDWLIAHMTVPDGLLTT